MLHPLYCTPLKARSRVPIVPAGDFPVYPLATRSPPSRPIHSPWRPQLLLTPAHVAARCEDSPSESSRFRPLDLCIAGGVERAGARGGGGVALGLGVGRGGSAGCGAGTLWAGRVCGGGGGGGEREALPAVFSRGRWLVPGAHRAGTRGVAGSLGDSAWHWSTRTADTVSTPPKGVVRGPCRGRKA